MCRTKYHRPGETYAPGSGLQERVGEWIERALSSRASVRAFLVQGILSLLVIFLIAALQSSNIYAQVTGETPKELQNVGLDEKLGGWVPTDLIFLDESGTSVRLGSFFDGERPVLLNFVYHDCPMLCDLVVDGLIQALSRMSWVPGREFELLTVSFNPAEGPQQAAEAKRHALHRLGNADAARGWHFLTGDQGAIDALSDAVGFRYHWVDEQQDFAHPSVLTFLSGEGIVSRYLYGVRYEPRDVRTALVEASDGKVGSTMDQVMLYCFQYDPDANSYVLHALNVMKLGGLLTVIVLGSVLAAYWRRESRRSRSTAPA